jgi:hypothetical protein
MMKRPSHCLIRRRCPFGTCMALICPQRKSSPNSADGLPVSRLKAAATDEEGQAFVGCPELRCPLLSHVNHALGALSP